MTWIEINETIYQRGIKGELTLEEINNLPKKYGIFKEFFKHALSLKKKINCK
jgi:hypothetical protein